MVDVQQLDQPKSQGLLQLQSLGIFWLLSQNTEVAIVARLKILFPKQKYSSFTHKKIRIVA